MRANGAIEPVTSSSRRRRVRADPVEVLERQAATRIPELVPIRYGRMPDRPLTGAGP